MVASAPPRPRDSVGLSTLLPYLRPHARVLAAIAVLSLLATAGTLSQPLLIRRVLDGLGSSEPVGGLAAMLVALLVAVGLVNGWRSFLLQRTAEGLVLATRRRLAGHLLRLPIAEYDRRRTGDLLSRAGTDTTLLRGVVAAGLLEIAVAVVMILGAAAVMILVDLLMFAVTVAALVGIVGGILIARRVRGASEQVLIATGEMTAALERAITAVRTIRSARAEQREAATVATTAANAFRAGVRMARLQSIVGPTVNTTIQCGFLTVLAIGGARVATGAMSVGDLAAFVLLLYLLMTPIGLGMQAYTQLQEGLGALQRIEDVLALPVETVVDPPATVVEPNPGAPAIEFDRVSFAYPAGELVLCGISLTVPRGTRTALVGPSGAGKSTALALVERFYDVASGAVRVNGVDVRDQPRAQLRAQLGYVEQDAPVLAGTIRDNLLLAAPDATEQELLAALAAVNLAELAHGARGGLDTQVGEGGVLLSGGERQRLAIARTLLAEPPILLLDEPTSNLDAQNELALRLAITAVAERHTVLLVAHRLATVVDADQIVVLDHGRVAGVGRHGELVESNSLYRELISHQLLAG